jgi:hypothetical protein
MNQRRTTTSINRRSQITPVLFLAVLALAMSALLTGCIIEPVGTDVFSPTLAPPAVDPTSQPPVNKFSFHDFVYRSLRAGCQEPNRRTG